jgi:phenylalanyl-tRNA synthetase beta subunit
VRTTLFDTYEKEGKISYAYRLVFQSLEKTLTDVEAGDIMKKIESTITEKGWEVR